MEDSLNGNFLIPAVALLALAAGPAVAQSNGNSSTSAPSGGARAATVWTPDAMARASLAPRPNVNPDDVRSAARSRAAVTPDQPGTTPAADLGNGDGPKERAAGDVRGKPLYWAGKLFYATPDGDYVCSA